MNRIITLIIVIILLVITELAIGEDFGFFRPLTKDFETEDIGEVVVEQTKPEKVTWTLNEIDRYLIYLKAKINEYENQVIELKALRELIEKEALKVKIKNKDGKES